MKFTRFVYVLILAFAIQSSFLIAQERIGGRAILKGEWKNQEVEYAQGRVAVILKAGRGKANIQNLLDKHRATVVQEFDELNWGLIEIPESNDIFPLIKDLEKNEHVIVAEPDLVGWASYNPNDPYFSDGHQWALRNTSQVPPGGTNDADIDAPEAWNISMGSSSQIIAILDSGIPMLGGALSHPDLNDPNKFIIGVDYTNDGQGVRDSLGHGSHVTGIAAAETNNSTGIAGVAGSCKVLVVQVFNWYGGSQTSWFRSGVIYAVDHGATVVNFSGRWISSSSTLQQGIQYAYDHGVLVVASAGNDNGAIGWPARYSATFNNVIAVGSTDPNDQRSGFSSYGSQLNVVAPGGTGGPVGPADVYSTTPNYSFRLQNEGVTQSYGYMSGTSMAAPHVSGLAGLLFSLAPSLTPLQVRNTIQQTADDKGRPERTTIMVMAALMPTMQ
jgi:thermitase